MCIETFEVLLRKRTCVKYRKYQYSISFNHETTTYHIGEESPTAEAKRKAEATSSKTKGKWLKITRKGLLVSAIGRVGKQESNYSFYNHPNFSS